MNSELDIEGSSEYFQIHQNHKNAQSFMFSGHNLAAVFV